MRILFLNHNVARSGGTFFRAYHFARVLAGRGHDVTLLTISPASRLGSVERIADGVRVVETPDLLWGSARSGWDPWDTLWRAAFVRRHQADLVHAFDSRPAVVLPALAAHRLGIPLVMDWADWWGRGGTIEERRPGAGLRAVVRPVETYFEEAFRTTARGTTVISTALRARAIGLGVAADTIAQIPNGCDVDRVVPLPKARCRHTLGLPADAPVVGYLGVLTRSDATLLFETFRQIRRARPDCRLLLVGNHKASPPPIEGLIETGFVPFDRMIEWLGACDVLLLPLKDTISSRGRWPSKVNDYLAAGRPVVASAVGDIATLFGRHAIGRAVADTPDALTAATVALLENPAELDQLGATARSVAETELSWSRLTDDLEAHYARTMRPLTTPVPSSARSVASL
jgi:glycosyltransferase involved in cell wall biosynthesis